MIFSPRISTRQLVGLCRRLATAVAAGIDIRTVWAGEAKRAIGTAARSKFLAISEAVNRGASLRESLEAADGFFPPLFCELVQVGDQTGHLDEAFAQLADHYDYQQTLARNFLLSILWPLVELGIAIVVIGVLIWALGWIAGNRGGEPIDILGLGLVGNQGLAIYATFWVCVICGCFFLYQAIRRGLVWTRPIQHGLIRLPVVGKALESMALARMTWSMQLALNSGMDTRRAIGLSVRSARNAKFTDHLQAIDRQIAAGNSLYEAFLETGACPGSFLDTLQVGEQTGEVVESMGRLSRQYRQEAEAAMKTLGVIGFFATFGVIAALIITMIFRIAGFYIGALNDAAQM
jgi:type IV pilus assembly protein PilC